VFLIALTMQLGWWFKEDRNFCYTAGFQSIVVPFASCNWLMKLNLISSTSLQIPSNATI